MEAVKHPEKCKAKYQNVWASRNRKHNVKRILKSQILFYRTGTRVRIVLWLVYLMVHPFHQGYIYIHDKLPTLKIYKLRLARLMILQWPPQLQIAQAHIGFQRWKVCLSLLSGKFLVDFFHFVVGRILTSYDVHVLIPETCEWVGSCAKGN